MDNEHKVVQFRTLAKLTAGPSFPDPSAPSFPGPWLRGFQAGQERRSWFFWGGFFSGLSISLFAVVALLAIITRSCP